MKQEGEGKRVRIYMSEGDQWWGRSLYASIVERCRAEGIAGATVLRGLKGYGAANEIRESRFLGFINQLPIVIEIVDTPERIDRLLPVLVERSISNLT